MQMTLNTNALDFFMLSESYGWTSSTMLIKRGEADISVLFPILRDMLIVFAYLV